MIFIYSLFHCCVRDFDSRDKDVKSVSHGILNQQPYIAVLILPQLDQPDTRMI